MTDQVTDPMQQVLSMYFGLSDPGDIMHHLVVARPTRPNAFGFPDLNTLELSVVAIAPAGEGTPEDLIASALLRAAGKGPVWGAALTMETHQVVVDTRDEVAENRMRRMRADRQLDQHPDAVETTTLYAACADTRRWWGTHWLTGPDAGTVDGPNLLEGPPTVWDRGDLSRLIRRTVGIRW